MLRDNVNGGRSRWALNLVPDNFYKYCQIHSTTHDNTRSKQLKSKQLLVKYALITVPQSLRATPCL